MMAETQADDDSSLIRRVAENRDQHALAELLARHVPKVTGDLHCRFRHVLQRCEIDDAVNRAAMKFWEKAGGFNRLKPFGPWFLEVAFNSALDILKGKKRKPTCELDFDPTDLESNRRDDDESEERSPRMAWMVEQLEQIIDYELSGFAQALARADLAAGGRADTERLMTLHNKSKSVVQSTRSKVWKIIRETILEREGLRGNVEVNQ